MGNCSSTSNCNPCGPDFSAINQLATKAGAYARQANTYAINAENSWLEFNALYLGAFAVAPTADNEGDPLQVGALYWNTVSNTIFAWNGTTWVENGNFNEFTNFSLPSATPVPAANLRTGQEYEIVVVGNTNWTAIGAPAAQVGVRFTKNAVAATGTGTARVTRDLVTRFADVVNVKDFGAVGDGVTDDTAAIQAALDSIPFSFGPTGKATVFFPDGEYQITNTIYVKSNFTGLTCGSFSSAAIRLTNFSVSEAIMVRSPFPNSSIFGFSMSNINLVREASSTYQKGLVLESCNNTHMTDVEIAGFPNCIDIRGGVNCHYTTLRLSDFGSTNATPDVGLLEINASTYVLNPVFFTHLFANSMIAGSRYCVKITSGDYLTFSNCYIGGGKQGDVLIEGGSIYENFSNYFDNCYFDYAQPGVSSLTKAAIDVKPGSINELKITDCRFGPWGVGVRIDNSYYPDVSITGTTFTRCNTAIEFSPTSTSTSLALTGNKFKGCGMITNNSTVIDIKDIRQITITGNDFYSDFADWTAYGQLVGIKKIISIAAGATVENISITGNVLDGFTFGGTTFVDFENLGTVNELTIVGNASNNPVNTLVGHVIGNRPSTNQLMLDWYQEGSWSPTIKFGGANVGLTYSARVGNYTRIGNRAIVDCYVQLSNKGTSTGELTIEGFPFPLSPSGISTGNLTISINGIDGIGEANVDCVFTTTTSAVIRSINVTGDPVNFTDANIRNTTFLYLSGSVQVE
jgi:hypothetical protein